MEILGEKNAFNSFIVQVSKETSLFNNKLQRKLVRGILSVSFFVFRLTSGTELVFTN